MDDSQLKQIKNFKEKFYKKSTVLKKPPKVGWQHIMSREQKAFRNRWNTESKPYTPTPKGELSAGKK